MNNQPDQCEEMYDLNEGLSVGQIEDRQAERRMFHEAVLGDADAQQRPVRCSLPLGHSGSHISMDVCLKDGEVVTVWDESWVHRLYAAGGFSSTTGAPRRRLS